MNKETQGERIIFLNGSDDGAKQTELLGFLDFFHRPIFQKIVDTTFWKLDLFPSSGVVEDTYSERANLFLRDLTE
jgi:hypothetical protein